MIVLPALAGGYMLAALTVCPAASVPAVALEFKDNPVQFDHTQSSQDLVKLREGSISPHYGSEFPIVGGITSGAFEAAYAMNFKGLSDPGSGQQCLWIDDVSLTLSYAPTVYVASNYKKGSCRYKLTESHEMMHVSVDLITAKEFLPRLKKTLEAAMTQVQVYGPIGEEKSKNVQTHLKEWLKGIVNKEMEALQQMRATRQQQVDSRQEYRRLSESCAGEAAR